jgi:L-lysine exporter family protein LysE/ArgO
VDVAVSGFLAGLSLIVAIGAQNAYVLRLGLTRNHVGIAVAICASADLLLIVAGIAGIGAVVRSHPDVLTVIRWVGVAYLLGYAIHSFWRARRPEVLDPADAPPKSAATVAAAMLAFTFLNPHVYLDTVLLLGSIGNQYGDDRWWFAAGASAASITWFATLGFGARAAAPLMARPITWRILDVLIGLVMILLALSLLRSDLAA